MHLLTGGTPPSGEALKTAESGLVAKCRQRMRNHDDVIERGMRLARRAAGIQDPRGLSIQTLWRNPEFRTEGELVDALVKMSTIGVPKVALWEKWGATPSEIARWQIMAKEEQAELLAMDPLTALAGHDLARPVPDMAPHGPAHQTGYMRRLAAQTWAYPCNWSEPPAACTLTLNETMTRSAVPW